MPLQEPGAAVSCWATFGVAEIVGPGAFLGAEVVVAGLVGSGGGGLTALVFASREGDLESAKLLVDAGADVNQTTEYGWTPLLTATNTVTISLASMPSTALTSTRRTRATAARPATDNQHRGGGIPVPKPDMDHLKTSSCRWARRRSE